MAMTPTLLNTTLALSLVQPPASELERIIQSLTDPLLHLQLNKYQTSPTSKHSIRELDMRFFFHSPFTILLNTTTLILAH